MDSIITITDFSAPELDIYARRTEAQLLNREHPEQGIFIAESPKVIERALDAGCSPISFLMEEKHINGEGSAILARCPGVPVYAASFETLTQLTGFQLTRGMLCAMHRPLLRTAEAVCKSARRIAILENVANPTNVGAVIRSAAALNMDAVLLAGNCSDPLYRRAIRVSMGTVFQIPWAFLGNPDTWPREGMAFLRDLGYQTAALALQEDTISLEDPRLQQIEKLAVLLGAEGDGLNLETIAACDFTIKIPMSHGVDSLNVAAASAVAFWQLGRNRP